MSGPSGPVGGACSMVWVQRGSARRPSVLARQTGCRALVSRETLVRGTVWWTVLAQRSRVPSRIGIAQAAFLEPQPASPGLRWTKRMSPTNRPAASTGRPRVTKGQVRPGQGEGPSAARARRRAKRGQGKTKGQGQGRCVIVVLPNRASHRPTPRAGQPSRWVARSIKRRAQPPAAQSRPATRPNPSPPRARPSAAVRSRSCPATRSPQAR